MPALGAVQRIHCGRVAPGPQGAASTKVGCEASAVHAFVATGVAWAQVSPWVHVVAARFAQRLSQFSSQQNGSALQTLAQHVAFQHPGVEWATVHGSEPVPQVPHDCVARCTQ
jgi:hypothetical protein